MPKVIKPRRRIATPLCRGGVSPTIRARYEDVVYASGLTDTGHYPATAVVEIWKRDEKENISIQKG